ncbi:MAG TPA: O-antigen ligase family protein, partial [Candidatus Methylomirabilis sp.]|nr:O-antigen ligase family protein [Candidatus Methylomirabilis sp.]
TLMAAPVAMVGIHQFFSGTFIPGAAVKRVLGYDAPLTDNPNDMALLLNLLLPLSMALLLGSRRVGLRIALVTFMALSVAAVILTFSRAGFVTLGVIILFYVWKLLRRSRYGCVLALLGLVLISIPFLPASYLNRLSTITDIQADPTGSAQARWADTEAAARYIAEHPLVGAGVGMDVLALNQVRGPTWKQVHDVYLEYAVDLGILGVLLFVCLLIACIRSAILAQRLSAEIPALRGFYFLAEGIQISLLAFAVAGLFHPAAYQFYFYYIAGLAVALRPVYEAEGGAVERTRSGSSDRRIEG